jgi:2,4-dienoyl-CoA reductase (NADPH2)
MDSTDIERVRQAFADGARRAVEAGFDMVEIHGGTGYLLPQFLSPRTNLRNDAYGGDTSRRMRFPLEVVAAVRTAVGPHFPVGYRFLADEYIDGGWTCAESLDFARQLLTYKPAWLSVMAGCYESFASPKYEADDHREAFLVPFARQIKQVVGATPVVGAGRIQSPDTAESVLQAGDCDLIGLGRVLFADPLWPKKASGELADPVVACAKGCFFCTKRMVEQMPAYCPRWSEARRKLFIARVGG